MTEIHPTQTPELAAQLQPSSSNNPPTEVLETDLDRVLLVLETEMNRTLDQVQRMFDLAKASISELKEQRRLSEDATAICRELTKALGPVRDTMSAAVDMADLASLRTEERMKDLATRNEQSLSVADPVVEPHLTPRVERPLVDIEDVQREFPALTQAEAVELTRLLNEAKPAEVLHIPPRLVPTTKLHLLRNIFARKILPSFNSKG